MSKIVLPPSPAIVSIQLPRSFAWRRLRDTLLFWSERARQRRVLSGLDEHILEDIGLTRAEVRREANKPFWR